MVLYDLKTMKFETAWSHRMSEVTRLEGKGIQRDTAKMCSHGEAPPLLRRSHAFSTSLLRAQRSVNMSAVQHDVSMPIAAFVLWTALKIINNSTSFPPKRQDLSESSRFPSFLGQKTVGFCEELRDVHRFSACSRLTMKGCGGLFTEEVFAGRG